MRRGLVTTLAWLVLSLAPAPGSAARGAEVYPQPPPSVLDAMRRQHRAKDYLRVTTDTARFVSRVRVLNEYGLVGLSIAEHRHDQPSQIPWSSIRRIEVETNHRALARFAAGLVGGAIMLSQGTSSSDNSTMYAIAGGTLLVGAAGGMLRHERLLYAAPGTSPEP